MGERVTLLAVELKAPNKKGHVLESALVDVCDTVADCANRSLHVAGGSWEPKVKSWAWTKLT